MPAASGGDPFVYLLLAGLAKLVPVPFVDDWLFRKALGRALADDAAAAGQPLDAATLEVLTEDRESMLLGCLRVAIVWPLKKLFRTVLWFLTLKDVADAWAWAALVLGMVRIGRERGWLPAHARQVRDAMEVALGRHRWSPVTRTLLRYDRPALEEASEPTGIGRFLQGIRRRAGAGPIERMYVERVRDEIAGTLGEGRPPGEPPAG
jgi:hypothetical protein